MGRAASGGRANWGGADFELRLGVEFCVDILRGEEAGLAPGAIRHVQPQAPGAIDDLVLEFETGTRWALQAKAGSSVRVEWNPGRPFGKALRQLYDGVTVGQIDASAESLDRAVLAVDHRAPRSITEFGDWLDQARHHHRWEYLVAAATNAREREWASQLPTFLDADAGDELLAFLKKCHVRRAPPPDEWRSRLRERLLRAGVPDADTADRILDLVLARVEAVFPHGGQVTREDLQQACAGIRGLPRPGTPPFRIYHDPGEEELYGALRMPAVRPARFVARPELEGALGSEQGVLVAGRPGSGKSHALIKLALARSEWPVAVVARHFRADDLGRLAAALQRIHTPYQLLWDDVHERVGIFADAVQRLAERGDWVRLLAAYREQYRATVTERVTPGLCRRAGIDPEPVRLEPLDRGQAQEMAGAVAEALDLDLDESAQAAYARHIGEGDGGPLFALATGLLLREEEERGRTVRAADVARLPEELVDTWRHLYERLAERPQGLAMQSLLGVLRFLHGIDCPLNVRLAELLYSRVLGHSRGELEGAARVLAGEGWLRQEGDQFAAHDVTLEAVPATADGARRFVAFAREEVAEGEVALGLLRGSLSLFYGRQVPRTRTAAERRSLLAEAVELGERAVADFRAAGHDTHLATSLNNASAFYSELAALEESRQGRAQRLQLALDAIEEAVRIRRGLGLQADLAMSLGTATLTYRAAAAVTEDGQEQIAWLRKALESIEKAVRLFRAAGIVQYLIQALTDCVICHLMLAERSGELDRERVLALCEEGEALCGPMGDEERLALFREVRRRMEGEG